MILRRPVLMPSAIQVCDDQASENCRCNGDDHDQTNLLIGSLAAGKHRVDPFELNTHEVFGVRTDGQCESTHLTFENSMALCLFPAAKRSFNFTDSPSNFSKFSITAAQ